jgi:release factor glutamine methyltransferase
MILSNALYQTREALLTQGIQDSYKEAELFLCHAANISRVQLYTVPEQELSEKEILHLEQMTKRRLQHEPTAYIINNWDFYNSNFYIDNRVLIPRPETELLVERTINVIDNLPSIPSQFAIADIGTGSGAIAASVALQLPNIRIYATDISDQALQVAGWNFYCLGLNNRIVTLEGSLLEPLDEKVNIIVANLPYVTEDEMMTLAPESKIFEPPVALNGGKDGLEIIRNLLYQAPKKMHSDGYILLEIGLNQDKILCSLIHKLFPKAVVKISSDLSGINRVIGIAGGIS